MIAIGERRVVGALREYEVASHQSGNPSPVVGGHRHVHAHGARACGYIPLPSHPQQREALPHQRPVAELRLGGRIERRRGLLEGDQHRLAATIADLVEQPAVAAPRIDRFQQVEVGARLDLAPPVARPQFEIDDEGIGWRFGIEREVDAADQLLVRPGRAEWPAGEHHFAPIDPQPDDARLRE